jgi:hypothetical protein
MSFRGFLRQLTSPALVIFDLTLALALAAAPASAGTLTCEVSGAGKIAHCFDRRGYESTEERSGHYVHGLGHAWTTWEHGGRTTTWPTR